MYYFADFAIGRVLPPSPIHAGTRNFAYKKFRRKLMQSLTPEQHKSLVNWHKETGRWYRAQKAATPIGIGPRMVHDHHHTIPSGLGKGEPFSVSQADENRVASMEWGLEDMDKFRRNPTPKNDWRKGKTLRDDPDLLTLPVLKSGDSSFSESTCLNQLPGSNRGRSLQKR